MKPIIRAKTSVIVRSYPGGMVQQSIGLAALFADNGYVSMRVRDYEQDEHGSIHLRIGEGVAMYFLTGLRDVCAAAFGRAPTEAASESPAPTAAPGVRDDVYVPGQPWRRGRWVVPMPKEVRS